MEIFIHIEPTTRIRYSALLCLSSSSSVRDAFDGWRVTKEISLSKNKNSFQTSEAMRTAWEHKKFEIPTFIKIRILLVGVLLHW